MADSQIDPALSDKTLSEQYVPLKQRDSQNIGPAPYIKEWVSVMAMTALGAVIGYFAGKKLEPRNLSMKLPLLGAKQVDSLSGSRMGGGIGGIYGIFQQWKYEEGQNLGVKNISNNLKTVIDPAQLETDTAKETALLADIKILDEKLSAPTSHGAAVLTRREADHQEIGVIA